MPVLAFLAAVALLFSIPAAAQVHQFTGNPQLDAQVTACDAHQVAPPAGLEQNGVTPPAPSWPAAYASCPATLAQWAAAIAAIPAPAPPMPVAPAPRPRTFLGGARP